MTNGQHIGSSGYTMWKTVARPEGDGWGQTRVFWLDWLPHSASSPSLQAREGGNMLGSRPALVGVSMQLPGN
jgi:hypothetical protein